MSKQEPTAWMSDDGDLVMDYDKPHNSHDAEYDIPLYKHELLLLTQEELEELWGASDGWFNFSQKLMFKMLEKSSG